MTRAWRFEVWEHHGFVFAPTRPAARAVVADSLLDVDYYRRFLDAARAVRRVTRAPEYDALAPKAKPGHAYTPEGIARLGGAS